MNNDWLLNAYRKQAERSATGAQPCIAEIHDGPHNNWGNSDGCQMNWRERLNAAK